MFFPIKEVDNIPSSLTALLGCEVAPYQLSTWLYPWAPKTKLGKYGTG